MSHLTKGRTYNPGLEYILVNARNSKKPLIAHPKPSYTDSEGQNRMKVDYWAKDDNSQYHEHEIVIPNDEKVEPVYQLEENLKAYVRKYNLLGYEILKCCNKD